MRSQKQRKRVLPGAPASRIPQITNKYIDVKCSIDYNKRHKERKRCEDMGRKAVAVLPQTQQLLHEVGEQIRLARLRRRLPSELVAERAKLSRATLTAIEKGAPSVAIGAYAAVLQALGGLERDLLLIARDDELGRKLQDLSLPQRQRAPRQNRKDETR